MSLHQLSEPSNSPRRCLLPRALMVALSLALAACDKPQTPEAQRFPTGAITNILRGSPLVLRQHLVQGVVKKTLGTTGGDFYTRGFALDGAHPSEWHINQLDVGFGPQRGTHVVTVKQENGRTHVKDMLDADNDGNVDFVESSVSWPVKKHDMWIPMTHIERDYTINQGTQDDFASALQKALVVLEAEKAKQK